MSSLEYFDFNDVLECGSTVSSLSMASREGPPKPKAKANRVDGLHRKLSSSDIQVFDLHRYDNVEHNWDHKPFAVRTMPSFFCVPRHKPLNEIRAKLVHAGCWDSEGLLLTDWNNPMSSKVYLGVKNVEAIPKGMKIEYLSGTWLSKVFVGEDKYLGEWVDMVEELVQQRFKTNFVTNRQWLSYYPTSSKPIPAGHTAITFFIKVSDRQT
jgi:hypothetical protein